ncbi:MAG: DUF2513 domain-containing protein [Aquidulcibacter sp.]|jgi:hypothetical protein|nr:DUF2513 domain-containing protein [Hyphomonadaceae bacterium]MCZ8195517.1 DUF2513 domain-containing protein [Aquidulcibacter sp.]
MKRDDDLIRDTLLKMEDADDYLFVCAPSFGDDLEERRLHFHLALLADAGYVLEINRGVYRLTNQGFDYLNTIRDGEIWKETRSAVSKIGGGTFSLIKEIGTALIKAELKARLGLDLG